MNNASFNYVRAFRQRHLLSESELGHLLGHRGQSAVAQFESGDRLPSLPATLALLVLFRMQPKDMFPGLYEWVEDGVMRRAAAMLDALEGKADRRSAAKREFLESLPKDPSADAP